MNMPLFADMGLASPLLNALAAQGFETPTPVQAQIIPQALQGGDWMVSSQTGSGKTLAFLLPVLHHIIQNDDSKLKSLAGPTALVLCPTRELAAQVAQDAITVLKQQRGVRVATVLGGMAFGKQIAELRGAQLVIATPGRLLDLVNQRKIHLNSVRALVLDEADRMLDLGFAEDLEAINALCAQREQTMMFSATFMPRIVGLAENIMKNPQRLELAQSHETNANIEQRLCWARDVSQKRKMLNHWLEQPDVVQAIVFASTQIDSENIARALNDDGISAAALHGAMPQAVRNRRIKSLREGSLKVLVATDVAARGIDVPAISHVINFGLPMKAEDYVHRIGRTGRAGREGVAVTLAEPNDRRKVAAIERYIKTRLPVANVEGFEPVSPDSFKRGTGSGPRGAGGRSQGGFRSERFGGGTDWPRDGGSRGAPRGERSFGDKPAFAAGRPTGEGRPFREAGASEQARPFRGDRPFREERPTGEVRQFRDARPSGEGRPFREERPFRAERSFGDRPASGENRSGGEGRPFRSERTFGDKPAFADRNTAGDRGNFGDRPARAPRAADGERSFAAKPRRPEIRWGQTANGDARGGAARPGKVKFSGR